MSHTFLINAANLSQSLIQVKMCAFPSTIRGPDWGSVSWPKMCFSFDLVLNSLNLLQDTLHLCRTQGEGGDHLRHHQPLKTEKPLLGLTRPNKQMVKQLSKSASTGTQ